MKILFTEHFLRRRFNQIFKNVNLNLKSNFQSNDVYIMYISLEFEIWAGESPATIGLA